MDNDLNLIDLVELVARIRQAAYLFWVSERRMPVAVVISTQLAQVLTGKTGKTVYTGLCDYGIIMLDDVTHVPLLGRDAYLDPLFLFL
jgi:hypothetical protein